VRTEKKKEIREREKPEKEDRIKREEVTGGAMAKWPFYPLSQLKMISLFCVVCCKPNFNFTMC
jgi:hypothetical protein